MDTIQEKQSKHFAFALYRYFPHGGLQKDFLRTLQEAVSRGHKVTVFAARCDASLPEMAGLTLRILPVKGCSNHKRMLSFARLVQAELAAGNFDASLMFSRIPGGDFYFAADNCLAVEWSRLHSPWILRFLPRYRAFLGLERAVITGKSRIFTISEHQIRDYQAAYQTETARFLPVPPGIDPLCKRPENVPEIRRAVRAQFGIPEDARLLVQVAAQFEVKGVDRSIHALAAQKDPDCRLLIAGGGKIAVFRAVAEKLQCADRVVFAGASSEIPRLLAASDLMIHPARKEAAGAVITEALAIGIPVLTTANCGFAHYAAALDERLVIPDPFDQTTCNEALTYALAQLPALSARAQSAENSRDFYRRAAVIVDHLES